MGLSTIQESRCIIICTQKLEYFLKLFTDYQILVFYSLPALKNYIVNLGIKKARTDNLQNQHYHLYAMSFHFFSFICCFVLDQKDIVCCAVSVKTTLFVDFLVKTALVVVLFQSRMVLFVVL